MHWVTDVKYLNEYKLEITFNDNIRKVVDLKNIVGGKGVFKPLQDIEFFKRVGIDPAGNTICWDNGSDICPDTLYEMGMLTINEI